MRILRKKLYRERRSRRRKRDQESREIPERRYIPLWFITQHLRTRTCNPRTGRNINFQQQKFMCTQLLRPQFLCLRTFLCMCMRMCMCRRRKSRLFDQGLLQNKPSSALPQPEALIFSTALFSFGPAKSAMATFTASAGIKGITPAARAAR